MARPVSVMSHPLRAIPVMFLTVLSLGTLLLSLPVARADPDEPLNLLTAAFTAVSATCITGLTVVDTATYWSSFGHVVIMALLQVGGFGIMSLATVLALIVGGRMGLTRTLAVQSESHTRQLGDVRGILTTVAVSVVGLELVIVVLLTARFWAVYDHEVGAALWHGVFHAVSAFNNGGFTLYPDNLMGFAGDPYILGPIFFGVVAGGLGFPVYYELRKRWRDPSTWSVHARVTLIGYITLFFLGCFGFGILEWTNPDTLGPMSTWDKLVNSVAGGVTPRTAGFNTVDNALMQHETWFLYDILMFIGGGSAGTSGGIKVGTFALLAFVLWAEVRGEPDVIVGHRMVPQAVQREALTVALLGIAIIVFGTTGLLLLTDFPLDRVLFEACSAFGTTGASTGITSALPGAAQLLLMAMMFIGRVGTITVASAIALNTRHRHYTLPEERPIIG